MRAIILAGCGDERLGSPLTDDSPAAALPVAGKPLVALLLDYLEGHGMSAAVVACCRWPHLVERSVEMRSGRMPVTTVLEQPQTGSANLVFRLASAWSETLLVAMGDVLADIDLEAAVLDHKRRGALATVVACSADHPCHYGEVGIDRDGAVVMVGSESLVLKGGHRTANSGICLLEPHALSYVPRGKSFDLTRDLLPLLVEKDLPVFASHQAGYWRAIGTVEQYRLANVDVLEGRVRGVSPGGEQLSPGVWVDADAAIDPEANLRPPVCIGRGSRIERDAVVGPDTVLGEDVHVKRGAVIAGSVILERSRVGLATRLEKVVARGNELAGKAASDCTRVGDREVLEPLRPTDFSRIAKNAFDRTMALVALALLSPLMLHIALLIKLDSPGPVFYTQLRVGEGRRSNGRCYQGRVIEVIKFRTMYQDADRRLKEVLARNEYGSAPFVKIREDPRITRVGRLLRATSLDELPQLINVLRGDMALVGNRPLPLYEAEMLSDEWQQIRFRAPAGLTGLWQISGRSDLSAEERMILDNYYALTRSFWSDIKILLVTIPALLARRGAR